MSKPKKFDLWFSAYSFVIWILPKINPYLEIEKTERIQLQLSALKFLFFNLWLSNFWSQNDKNCSACSFQLASLLCRKQPVFRLKKLVHGRCEASEKINVNFMQFVCESKSVNWLNTRFDHRSIFFFVRTPAECVFPIWRRFFPVFCILFYIRTYKFSATLFSYTLHSAEIIYFSRLSFRKTPNDHFDLLKCVYNMAYPTTRVLKYNDIYRAVIYVINIFTYI